ncbi:MAG: hypothetical protein JSV50_20490 [Desulfobacteraceae bacterium]|nr:MAG: hypothetical protein JSV50_20490 [Desulfobacteraceae bacterium]
MTETSRRKVLPGRSVAPKKRLGLDERLGLIGLIDEGMRLGSHHCPVISDLFNDLWDLVSKTVSGSKIDSLKPEDSKNGFRVFEINAETGENLGRLNMSYLKKPIPCYYLVYVEVAAPFRRKGLGNRILEYFRDFLIKKSAVGILDNIIPEDDSTYSIYFKQGWEPVEAIIGDNITDADDNYMIYLPPRFQDQDLHESIVKLVYHLKRKRAEIDMRDNEVMVQRTIEEFKDLHLALLTYFERAIQKNEQTPLMRFMFTRFVTKLIAFRRRIGDLIGYTGGDSLEQIVLTPEIAALPVQSYSPYDLASEPSLVIGNRDMYLRLPQIMKTQPARSIERLPNYRRPSFVKWMKERGIEASDTLNIGDLMDLGFDPTRLKEITIGGRELIFERIQARQIPELERKKEVLDHLTSGMPGTRARNAQLRVNPPLLAIRDRGNAYVLRQKVSGIHWEEAIEQLQGSPHLRSLNASLKTDRMVFNTVKKANEIVTKLLSVIGEETLVSLLTYFISWDLKSNQPKLLVDFTGTCLESVWVA